MNGPPMSAEAHTKLEGITLERFLRAWTSTPDRIPDCEDSAAVLDVWNLLGEVGVDPPIWVTVAYAALHYGRQGLG
jgi:hypothetical protein